MRSLWFRCALVSASVWAFGCGDDDSVDDDAGIDASAADAGAGSSCLDIITCGSGCAGNPECQRACTDEGSPTAVEQYDALFACAYGACISPSEGDPSCTSTDDDSTTCSDCVAAAAQAEGCSTELATCLTGRAPR